MNSEIEQRIVAMYFDNKDFEKNAKQTIDTLSELKENLNLEDSVRGFDELDKAGKKLNLSQARTTVRNLKDAVGGLGEGLKKAFNIGTAPIHALDNFFNTFRGYVSKFIGFDLASKFVNSLESALRQLTVAPIEAGWSMYQANVDSTKTIMSGTLKSYKEQMSKVNADWTYDEGEHMEYVKGQLAELSSYAQKTVFSLSDMTSNVGKFTNNNIDLETSVNAMEGIANMAAKAGQGAQQASMAMYNFSQALGVGKMTSIDWKSIENANMATTELKDLFIQTAEAAGKLTKKVTKTNDGKEIEKFFITMDKNGKKLAKNKWIEVSAENFRDSLSNGWLDKDTMLKVMQIYSGKVRDLDTLAAMGFDINDTELVEQLFAIGEEAEKAATQVRTFQKMWDAMTESVQSGWADSMQYIFGDMLEATDFWTTVNDKIGEVLDNSAENRNNILREWRGLTFNEETGEWERLEGAVDGREDLIQGIYGVIDAAKSLGSAFSVAWSDVFGNMTGGKLQEITKGFRDFIDRFKEWLGDMDDTNSRLSKIRKAVSGVFSVLKIGATIIKAVFDLGIKIIKPFIDPLLNLFSKFGEKLNLSGAKNLGEMLTMLRDRFTGLWNKLKEMGLGGIFSKIGEKLGNLWNSIKEGVGNFLDENGLSGVKDWFVQLGDKIQEGYETVKTWWEGSGIPAFFKRIWDQVTGWFTPKEGTPIYDSTGRHATYEDSPIVAFFKGIVSGVESAWKSIKEWEGWNAIGNFFKGIWNKITGWFKPKEGIPIYDSTGRHATYEDSPIVAFFKGIVSGVESAWNSVKEWEGWDAIGKFFKGIWNKVTGWFKPKEGTPIYDSTGRHATYEDSPIVSFFKGIVSGVESAWNSIKEWEGWDEIGKFFEGIWKKVSSLFEPKEGTPIYDSTGRHATYEDAPIVAFFKRMKDGLVSAWNTLKGWEGWEEIGKFFGDIWGWIENIFNGDNNVAETVEKATEIGGTSGATSETAKDTKESVGFLERIVKSISDFISNVMESINGVVIPPEVSEFFVNLGDVLKGVFGVISDLLGVVGRILNGGMTADDWHLLIGVIAAFLTDKVYNLFNNKYLSGIQAESFASKFMSLGIGMLAIAGALSLLTTIDQDKMWSAAGALAGLMLVMGFVVNQLTKKTQAQTALTNSLGVTSTERVLTKLIGALEKVGMIAVVMAMLPDVIKAFGEAKKMAPELSGLDILETLTGVMVAISGISLALAAVDRITGGVGIDPVAAIKTTLAVLAAIGLILGAAAGIVLLTNALVGDDLDGTIDAINQAATVLAALGGAIGSFFAGAIGGGTEGQKVIRANEAAEKLDEMAQIFDEEKVTGINRMIRMMESISKGAREVDTYNLSGFAQMMGNFGDGIYTIAAKLSEVDGPLADIGDPQSGMYAKLTNFMTLMGMFADATKTLATFDVQGFFNTINQLSSDIEKDYWTDGEHVKESGLEHWVGSLEKIFKRLGEEDWVKDNGIQFDGLNIAGKLLTALEEGLRDPSLPAFDATPVTDAILKALKLEDTAIAEVVHNMVQNGLKLSGTDGEGNPLSISDENADLLKSLLGGESDGLGGMNNITSDFQETLYGKDGKGGIMGTWKGFQSEMEGIEIPDMSQKLADSFDFKDPETGEDLDLTAKLKETLGDFEKTLNDETEFQIKIVPTFDLSNLNEESLRAALGDYPVGLPLQFSMPDLLQVDFTGMASELNMNDIRSRITDITIAVNNNGAATVVAINNMRDKIDGLEGAIRQLKLYLDTGALVGGITPMIDKALGRRANWADSGGIPIDSFVNPYAK